LQREPEIPSAAEDRSSLDGVKSLLSAIVNNSDDAIISKTLEGIITSWNPAAERMFGYTSAEVIGQSIRLIIPAELQAEEDFVLGEIRSGNKVDHFETIRQTKDGQRLNISLTASPIRDAQGIIVGASKIARNITDKKRMEREREEMLTVERHLREQYELALKARDEFIAIAAHELRNPLNVFQLSLQLLHRVSSAPAGMDRVRSLVEKSQFQLTRLSSLVDRLLDVTRLRSGTFDLYRETFDLSVIISEVVARFIAGNPREQISIERTSTITGNWDRIRIDQALTNLVSNAIKYGQGKPIVVSASSDGQQTVIKVRDHGIGIAKDDLERIFDQFERATQHTGSEGLGLGLWITRRIAEAHGGSVRAESEPGNGTTFILHLPIQANCIVV
jgi:PAS domain S-box-containing protein